MKYDVSFDFETIVSNLVTNSSTIFKNHKVEKPTIKIEIGRNDDKFYIKYSDNGPGLCTAFKKEPQKFLSMVLRIEEMQMVK